MTRGSRPRQRRRDPSRIPTAGFRFALALRASGEGRRARAALVEAVAQRCRRFEAGDGGGCGAGSRRPAGRAPRSGGRWPSAAPRQAPGFASTTRKRKSAWGDFRWSTDCPAGQASRTAASEFSVRHRGFRHARSRASMGACAQPSCTAPATSASRTCPTPGSVEPTDALVRVTPRLHLRQRSVAVQDDGHERRRATHGPRGHRRRRGGRRRRPHA